MSAIHCSVVEIVHIERVVKIRVSQVGIDDVLVAAVVLLLQVALRGSCRGAGGRWSWGCSRGRCGRRRRGRGALWHLW